jgi:hypothetical protein
MSLSNREQWFADVLRAGLETHILAEPDILAHATPAVLIGSLPKDVVVLLLDATLATGSMSPEAVVQTATPEILAAHVPPPVVWACIAAAAQRAGFAGEGQPEAAGAREFLRRALDQALTHGIATPSDLVDDVNANVIGHHFPDSLTTRLLEASLAAGRMNPELILETLGTAAISKHAPAHVVWACLARTGAPPAAARGAEPQPAPPQPAPPTQPPPPQQSPPQQSLSASPAPQSSLSASLKASLDLFDDDMASVLVELDDGSGTMEVTHDKDEPALAAATTTDDKKKGGGGRAGKRA